MYGAENLRRQLADYEWAIEVFEHYQEIPTIAASSVTSFLISGTTYLAFASRLDDSGNYTMASPVFVWDPAAAEFTLHQTVLTTGARDLAAFTLGGTPLS